MRRSHGNRMVELAESGAGLEPGGLRGNVYFDLIEIDEVEQSCGDGMVGCGKGKGFVAVAAAAEADCEGGCAAAEDGGSEGREVVREDDGGGMVREVWGRKAKVLNGGGEEIVKIGVFGKGEVLDV